MTQGALKFLGYASIQSISYPENTLGVLLREKTELVITDYNTAKVAKPGLIKAIKTHPEIRRVSVILLYSNDLSTDEIKQMHKEGASAMLTYPFKMNDLQKAINDALRSVSDSISDTYSKIRRLDFFSFMTDEEVLKLLKMSKCRNYNKSDIIFEEGQTGDRFYVIIEGTVGIYKQLADGAVAKLAENKEGECFGEMAILDGSPRSASARAMSNVLMFELDSNIMGGYEDIITLKLFKKLTIVLSERLRDSDLKIKELALYAQD
ncbi:Cyclic nucleotide-binding domain protein [Candidatus Magnetoovum chiemensis]|nr:Cyclic nucleotide-binding domain protein [Candidatus Magnetoovum chiemensis]